jgi:hypothetical protein
LLGYRFFNQVSNADLQQQLKALQLQFVAVTQVRQTISCFRLFSFRTHLVGCAVSPTATLGQSGQV